MDKQLLLDSIQKEIDLTEDEIVRLLAVVKSKKSEEETIFAVGGRSEQVCSFCRFGLSKKLLRG
jgi:hypothetical protein